MELIFSLASVLGALLIGAISSGPSFYATTSYNNIPWDDRPRPVSVSAGNVGCEFEGQFLWYPH